jgi:hypothetical protein
MWVLNSSGSWSSSNGANWTTITQTTSWGARYDFAATSFKNKLWVLGGAYGIRGTIYTLDDLWASDSGQAWTRSCNYSSFRRVGHRLDCFDGRMWLTGGGSPPLAYSHGIGDIWSSNDGVNWTQVTSKAAFPGRFNHGSVVLNNKLWILGGENEDGALSDVWYSPGGNASADPAESGWPHYE